MMAINPNMPSRSSRPRSTLFTRMSAMGSCSPAGSRSRLPRRPGSPSRRSADLAGRAVALSPAIPAGFDVPLAAHHTLLGRWAAGRQPIGEPVTRAAARHHIEAVFDTAVQEAMAGIDIADFRVVVLKGEDGQPPAIAIICDSMGQIELGWIEQTNVLAHTLKGIVAPAGWRARAYQMLVETLPAALPVFSYEDMIEELSAYYWDGETDDARAIEALAHFGHEEGDVILPSQVHAKRPDFMLADNAAPLKAMPVELANALRRLTSAHTALTKFGEGNAWYFSFDELVLYAPEYEDGSHLPPMTLVPFDVFHAEIDEVTRMAMETQFMSAAGLCPLPDVAAVDRWFASLRLGAELLRAAQDLIAFDPFADRKRA
ncbi:hypothetical protein [Novosphingobium sp.]|uniref:hypothetical protein n=1 Tax=Novosphingobium sp. TaxID=1874826 RepID=UPI0038B9B2E6